MKSSSVPHIRIARVDYGDPADCAALVMLLDAYACDLMGGGVPLEAAVKERLCADLARLPGAASFLARNAAGEHPEAVGLINCFLGYSTFKAQPLMNVHDIIVLGSQRGMGIGQMLLAAAEQHARSLGCCKLTLEVLTGNATAMASYRRFGFAPYTLDPAAGQASFMQKWL
jgi:GNAT superfamily N-acetyltransferase